MIDPLYAISGFAVGLLVGMTGVGGGSLMTPLLILLFGIHPATAVGTDLLYAAATKTGGSLFHGIAHNIEWPIVKRLAMGSLPASICTLLLLSIMDLDSQAARSLITLLLCFALIVTAAVLALRDPIVAALRKRFDEIDPRAAAIATPVIGAFVGVLVSISSVGAGAIGFMALVILYPRLTLARIVGSDIAHAVPLTLAAGIGHSLIGTVDWPIVGALLTGSLPGIFLGSYLAMKMPETALRFILAVTLIAVAARLAFA
ncbi:MAG: sulfite exporter TauE/SafE family protein [Hyphomicrobiales bacterium]|nr:sulfite exporter TauE/SafE family protein [Hyphomicrobiales bacterium]MBV8769230.1 sulfite exporter TauE/SafE family protein [Hyphomicrobiales bacterium]MBV9051953.1 sulfite exporter TauE/SafE family protein [Hyphomicrobiales bacterium]MBV9975275.1 sulfite exporter TauE/SafE family protein [Hyphomicrobiales bacterium]